MEAEADSEKAPSWRSCANTLVTSWAASPNLKGHVSVSTSAQGLSCRSLLLISVGPSLTTARFVLPDSTGTMNMVWRHLLLVARKCQVACSQEGAVHGRGEGVPYTALLQKRWFGVGGAGR